MQAQMSSIDELNVDRRTVTGGALHRTDTRERLRDGDRIVATSGDDIDSAGGLDSPSNVTRDFGALDIRVTSHRREKRPCFDHRVMIEAERTVLARRRDPLKNFRGCLRPELGDRRQASVARSGLELLDRVDVQCFADLVNPRGGQARNGQHVHESLGHRFAKLLEVARLACLHEIAHDGQRRRTQTAHPRERAGLQHRREIIRAEREDRCRRAGVRPNLERAFPVELEVRRDLRQHVRGGARIHSVQYGLGGESDPTLASLA
jgi:hypothetical protein